MEPGLSKAKNRLVKCCHVESHLATKATISPAEFASVEYKARLSLFGLKWVLVDAQRVRPFRLVSLNRLNVKNDGTLKTDRFV
jgi:hypothetical protein